MTETQRSLRIGYLMQADSVNMAEVSGPQLHVEAVVRGLERRGHQVRTIAIQHGKTQWSDDLVTWHEGEYQMSNGRCFRAMESIIRGLQSRLGLPFFRLFDSYRYSEACAAAMSGYDILYERFGMISYGGLIAARQLKIPIVYEVNGDLVEEYAQYGIKMSRAQWAVINRITQWMLLKATHIVAVGETIKRRIAERWHLPPETISVVRNGANVDLFLSGQMTRQDGCTADGCMNIIFVGSFQPWHGVDLLVDAFSRVAPLKPSAQLLLVGDGTQRREVERKVEELGLTARVQFLGKVAHPEVAKLLAKAEVAVICHPSAAAEIVETPLKLFEYMAAGKAVVAPAVPNMERVLTHGANSVLFRPDDANALADAILGLLSDPQLRMRLGQAARREAIQNHSWQRAVLELERIMVRYVLGPSL